MLQLKSESELIALSKVGHEIRQGYLDRFLRIREKSTFDKKIIYELTFKSRIKNRVVEVTKSIDKRDFDDLWTVCHIKLNKKRYDLISNGDKWEIDFFKNDDKTYFVLAEYEMPEGQTEPEIIPKAIKKHIIYEVPLKNTNFSSRRLASIGYAKKALKKLS